jgi:hypothetical protein
MVGGQTRHAKSSRLNHFNFGVLKLIIIIFYAAYFANTLDAKMARGHKQFSIWLDHAPD